MLLEPEAFNTSLRAKPFVKPLNKVLRRPKMLRVLSAFELVSYAVIERVTGEIHTLLLGRHVTYKTEHRCRSLWIPKQSGHARSIAPQG